MDGEPMGNNFVYYICPVCGYYSLTSDRFPACDFCRNDSLIIFQSQETDNIMNAIKKLPDEELGQYLYFEKADEYRYPKWKKDPEKKRRFDTGVALREYLRQKYVFNNPMFDKEKYNQRVDWSLERAKAQDAQTAENARRAAEEASRPRCPKCGCTEFQMVPRKWSPLTGFLTNKVDRVCVKCKTRF